MTPTALTQVLVIDDDEDVVKAARMALAGESLVVTCLTAPTDLPATLSRGGFDVLLADMNFTPGARDGSEGLSVLDVVRGIDPTLSIVFITAYGGVSLAVSAFRLGGEDFILKPWRNADLITAVRRAAERTALRRSEQKSLSLRELERRAIEHAMRESRGSIAQAARILGLTRTALYRRLEKHGL